MKRFLKRGIAIALSVLMSGEAVLVSAAEGNFWKERRETIAAQDPSSTPPSLAMLPGSSPLGQLPPAVAETLLKGLTPSLPKHLTLPVHDRYVAIFESLKPAYGTIRNVNIPEKQSESSRLVIHLQDIHRNAEAQTNIAENVKHLLANPHVDLLALEGQFRDVDYSPAYRYSGKKSLKTVSNYLLKHHIITGPVYAALNAASRLPAVIGIDDRALYDARDCCESSPSSVIPAL